jgi:hypothetical protein
MIQSPHLLHEYTTIEKTSFTNSVNKSFHNVVLREDIKILSKGSDKKVIFSLGRQGV